MPTTARRLVLLRHAKSAWPDRVADRDRPLAARGRRDAAEAGRWLRDAGIVPDLVLVSPAQRARETWDGVAGTIGSLGEVVVSDEVYGGTTGDLLDLLRGLGDDVRTALVVGHNPETERLADLLASDWDGDMVGLARLRLKYPTAAIAVLDTTGPWADLNRGTCRLAAFAVPRG